MRGQYIIVKSITYAYKGKQLLESKNIPCSIERAPANLASYGCNYAISLNNPEQIQKALNYLNVAKIKVLSYGEP